MKNIQAFKALIDVPGRMVIITHFKPDADALGIGHLCEQFTSQHPHRCKMGTRGHGRLNWRCGRRHQAASEDRLEPGSGIPALRTLLSVSPAANRRWSSRSSAIACPPQAPYASLLTNA